MTPIGIGLRALGALDFDDLLSEGLKVDTAGQRRFTHLLVDEFQDVSQIQYELVRCGAGMERVCSSSATLTSLSTAFGGRQASASSSC